MGYNLQSQVTQEQRDRDLAEKGQVEIPLEIDTDRYVFIFKLRHLIYVLPLIVVSSIGVFMLRNTESINVPLYVYLFMYLPPILLFTFLQFESGYGRKNINLVTEMYYSYEFKKKKKEFIFTKDFNITNKGEFMTDIRSILDIYDITNDCYETIDDHLVKVLDVSSINLKTLSEREESRVYNSFETFLNNLEDEYLPMQFMIYAKPISLKDYINYCKTETQYNEDFKSRLMAQSYLDYTNDIQKNRNMVSRNRFIAISVKYKDTDSFDELDKKAHRLKSKIENMLVGNLKLNANILYNKELHELQHTIIDYEGSQLNSYTSSYNTDVSLSEKEFKEAKREYEEEKANRIQV